MAATRIRLSCCNRPNAFEC